METLPDQTKYWQWIIWKIVHIRLERMLKNCMLNKKSNECRQKPTYQRPCLEELNSFQSRARKPNLHNIACKNSTSTISTLLHYNVISIERQYTRYRKLFPIKQSVQGKYFKNLFQISLQPWSRQLSTFIQQSASWSPCHATAACNAIDNQTQTGHFVVGTS